MTDITGTAHAHRGAVGVEVYPGGALAELTLSTPALALGPQALADSILGAVAEATALANQRTKHALRESLAGLGDRELAALGLDHGVALTERVEATTPQSWRAS
jgi:hypothetical protein